MAYDSHGGPGQYHSTSSEHGDGRPQVVLVQPAARLDSGAPPGGGPVCAAPPPHHRGTGVVPCGPAHLRRRASPHDCRDRPAQSGGRMLTLPPLADFSAWLKGRPWDAVVGMRLDVSCCPLSQWLLEALHAEVVLVDEASVHVLLPEAEWEQCPTPDPYVAVIEAIDYAGATPRREVQVQEVRHVLSMLG